VTGPGLCSRLPGSGLRAAGRVWLRTRESSHAGQGFSAGRRLAPGILILLLIALAGCAPARLSLPTASGTPLADPASILTEALGHCAALRTLTAEIGLSGRAAGQRLRVRLIAGFAAPDRIRLEAVAPIGGPVFILVSEGRSTTLLLTRDERVLSDVPPSAILEALAGIRVEPATLRRLLAGCPAEDVDARDARAIGSEWVIAGTADHGTAYFRRRGGRWRLAAVRGASLDAELGPGSGEQPAYVRLLNAAGSSGAPFDLTLRLSQVEVNVELPGEAFTVRVPATAAPITLDELRQSGPLRNRSSS
jgi:hypothetical protein